MTSISITVSPNFFNDKLSKLLALNDTSINESILNYGVILFENQSFITSNDQIIKLNHELADSKLKFNKINDDYTSLRFDLEQQFIESFSSKESNYLHKIKFLESEVIKLKNDNTLEISSLIEKGKLLTKDEYDKILHLHLKNNDDLKFYYDNLISELSSKNNILDNTINTLQSNNTDLNNKLIELYKNTQNNHLDNINGNINSLNIKFSNYFDKIFKGNTEKGNYGEHFIHNFLIDKFSNSSIIDTHKDSAKGDILFSFDNIKLLIESKNVQSIKKDDTDKFFRDIQLQASKNIINSALLISLNDTNLINGIRNFHFEIKFNIPIIMISNAFNNPEFIRFSILILNYLVKNGFANNLSHDHKLFNIISSLNQIFDIFKSQLIYLNNDKQSISKLHESLLKREADLLNIDKLFSNIFSFYPDLSFNSSKNTYPKNTYPNNTFPKNTYPTNTDPSNTDPSNADPNNTDPSNADPSNADPNNTDPSNADPNNTDPIITPNSIHSLHDILSIIHNHISHNPSFSINFKNLLSINIPHNIIRKFGGIKFIINSYNSFNQLTHNSSINSSLIEYPTFSSNNIIL